MRVESANAYVANQHLGCLHDCIFPICDNCGQTTHIDDDNVTTVCEAAANAPPPATGDRSPRQVRGLQLDCLDASSALSAARPFIIRFQLQRALVGEDGFGLATVGGQRLRHSCRKGWRRRDGAKG